jgi:hypothetical protein
MIESQKCAKIYLPRENMSGADGRGCLEWLMINSIKKHLFDVCIGWFYFIDLIRL